MVVDHSPWRYGERNEVQFPVTPGVIIDIGDLLFLDKGDDEFGVVTPARLIHPNLPRKSAPQEGDMWNAQAVFISSFLGVAMSVETIQAREWVTVATTGAFEFPLLTGCEEQRVMAGDLFTVASSLNGGRITFHSRVIMRCKPNVYSRGFSPIMIAERVYLESTSSLLVSIRSPILYR